MHVKILQNKSAKLTQNTPVVFVVNLMVMTKSLGAGYSTWRANIRLFSFLTIQGPYFRSAWAIRLVIELGRDVMPTNIFTKFDQDMTKTL